MAVYTISRAFYRSADGHPQAECVVFVMKDISEEEVFSIEIRRRQFQNMNNQQVMSRLEEDCAWWDRKITAEGGGTDYVALPVFFSKIASFEGQEVAT